MSQRTFSLPDNSSFSAEEVRRFRADTQGTRHVIHLNNAGAGLMPDIVTQTQLDHLNLEAQIGGYEAAALRAASIDNFYEQCAKLFGCKPSNIAFAASATDAFTRALSSVSFAAGDVILTDRDDFVSNQIQFLSLKKRFGIEIIHIRNSAVGGVDLNDLREQLHRHRPKLLAITHIPTNSGLVQPVHEIGEIYREYSQLYPEGTWYILDACQSAGQLKLDINRLHCDFMSITCRKFLRGPRGTGALYVSDRALAGRLEPLFIDMRGAEWKESGHYHQRPDAKRFEDWEFAYSTVVGTTAAIEYCLAIGEDLIWHQVKLLSSIVREKLGSVKGVRTLDRGTEQGGLVTFHVDGSNPRHIVAELLRRRINVVPSFRAFGVLDFDEKGVEWAVRASPHYYNTLDEIDTFIECIREIAGSKQAIAPA